MTPAPPSPEPPAGPDAGALTIAAFQRRIEALYGPRDAARGTDGTFVWFVEEVGELARAIRRGEATNLREEFSDVLAWLATLASLEGVDLAGAADRYRRACPRCGASPCACPPRSDRGPARG